MRGALLATALLSQAAMAQTPQGTAFTYQGQLSEGGSPAGGTYDFQLILYDAAVGGNQVGPTVAIDDVVVAQGLFTVSLDFGVVFSGSKRWLELGVRPGAGTDPDPYTPVLPRQELAPAPAATFSAETPWTGVSGKPPGFADDVDNDTTYDAGEGLDLAGTVFSITDGGVTTPKLAADAVTSPQIADGTIALADLGQNGCAGSQVMKWNGAAWACAADDDTTYTAGAGLDLAGTTFSLADLGVTTPKLAVSAVTSAKIADGTVALADLGQNGCAADQVMKWSGTAWACAPDVDTNSGGTVTTVATGAGLTGGPIVVTGTVAVAVGGITSSLIANGAVGLAQINPAQVQARVAGSCAVGLYLRGINPDGSVVCEPLTPGFGITTVDDPAVNSVGAYTSIAIGADGLPVVSYQDTTADSLKVAHCGNAACSAGNVVVTLDDPANSVGLYTSVAIGADGLPVISYQDLTAGTLKVAHCGNATCTGGNLVTTVDDPANSVGSHTSIAIGTDGLPVVSYRDASAFALKVVHCGNAACTAGNLVLTVDDPANQVGSSTSIAIGADGLPIISYQDTTAGALKVAHCGNVGCSAGNVVTTVDDPLNFVGGNSSIAIGPDGLPVISYFDGTGSLKAAHCGNAACSAGNVVTIVDDPVNFVGAFGSLAVGPDGLAVISYFDQTAFALKVAHCGDSTCTAGNTTTTVDDPVNVVGQFTSVAIGSDGLPVISHHDFTAGALKVAKCSTRTCQ